jgi:hypothetical protein
MKKLNSGKKLLGFLFFILAILIILDLIFLISIVPKIEEDIICNNSDNPRVCLSQKASKIALNKGVEESLRYLSSERENISYIHLHSALHSIGHQSYNQSGQNLYKALSYIPKEAFTTKEYYAYDGYFYGIFAEFFKDNNKNYTVKELMRTVCDDNPFFKDKKSIAWKDCYHGVGHAIIALNKNYVQESLKDCDLSPNEYSMDQCYRGVFMEQIYPHYKYPEDSNVSIDSNLFPFCNSIDEKYKNQCASFAGVIYFVNHPGEFEKTFNLCKSLDEEKYIKECIKRISLTVLTTTFEHDIDKIKKTCELSGEYEEYCIDETKEGLQFGFAGPRNKHLSIYL